MCRVQATSPTSSACRIWAVLNCNAARSSCSSRSCRRSAGPDAAAAVLLPAALAPGAASCGDQSFMSGAKQRIIQQVVAGGLLRSLALCCRWMVLLKALLQGCRRCVTAVKQMC